MSSSIIIIPNLLLLALNIIFVFGYVPLNRLKSGGKKPKTKYDDHVPFIPYFVYPYIVVYCLWILYTYLSIFWLPSFFGKSLTLSTILGTTIGYFCFYFFPTYYECKYPEGSGLTYKLLQHIHKVDKPNNACPSMHVFMAIILFYYSLGNNLIKNLVFFIFCISIIVSTVLIKRHYLLDIFGGVFLSLFTIYLTNVFIS